MGYANSTIQEGNVDDGFSSAMYDAQFKPSSTNLPPLGNITSLVSGIIKPATVDSSTFKPTFGIPTAPIYNKPISAPAPVPVPQVPIAVAPFGTGGVTGIVTGPAPTGIINQITNSPIQDTGLPALPTTPIIPPSTQTAQNNANTLQQQSTQAAASGNASLAAALAAQAQSWQSMANGLATGSVVSPLSADSGVDITAPSNNSPTVVKAGMLGNIKPAYLLAAAAAALFFLNKK